MNLEIVENNKRLEKTIIKNQLKAAQNNKSKKVQKKSLEKNQKQDKKIITQKSKK